MGESVESRDRYLHFEPITTRWNDNDVYGHVNNMVYYGYIDTAVNRFLVERGGLQIGRSPVIGVVAESMCRFRSAISYPERVAVGMRTGKLGNSSVRYEVGVFREDDREAAAWGHFVHVFVDRSTMRPVPIPDPIRAALASLIPGNG